MYDSSVPHELYSSVTMMGWPHSTMDVLWTDLPRLHKDVV